jgi:hypothetical protein
MEEMAVLVLRLLFQEHQQLILVVVGALEDRHQREVESEVQVAVVMAQEPIMK